MDGDSDLTVETPKLGMRFALRIEAVFCLNNFLLHLTADIANDQTTLTASYL
jgi:hypothetical protein